MPLIHRPKSLRRDEQGSALIAVVGIALVTIVLAVTVSTTTLAALERTDDGRDIVAAEFAAEAGVAMAQVDLDANVCAAHGPVYDSGSTAAPFYRAVVLRHTATGPQVGCPSESQGASIISTGYANAAQYSARSTDRRSVEALYTRTPVPLFPSGPAVFADSAVGAGGSGTLVGQSGLEASIHVRSGDVECTGTSAGSANWIVEAGNFVSQGTCQIGGSVWASGSATLNGGIIKGNIVARTVDAAGAQVGGSLWSSEGMTVRSNAQIDGNISVGTDLAYRGGRTGNTSKSPVRGDAWVQRNTSVETTNDNIHGTLYTWTISGTTNQVNAISPKTVGSAVGAPAAPAKPIVANWVSLGLDTTMWHGFTPVTMSGTCDATALRAALASVAGQQAVIDATGCTGDFTVGNSIIELQNDVAIVANSISLFGSGGFRSADGDQLWLINPDQPAAGPQCPAGTKLAVGGSFTFTNVPVMFYTPCMLNIESGISFTGQIFAGSFDISGGATMTFQPAGLPGFDLATGTPVAATAPRELTSYQTTRRYAEEWIP